MSFLEQLDQFKSKIYEQAEVALVRAEGLGLPQRNQEAWKYTSLRDLEKKSFIPYGDSTFQVQASGCQIESRVVLEKPQDCDFFDTLNVATLTHAYHVLVPSNYSGDIHIETHLKNNELLSPLLVVEVGAGSSVRFVENLNLQDGFLNARIVIKLQKNSKAEYLRLCDGEAPYVVSYLQTEQEKDSHFKFVQFGKGYPLFRQNVICNLRDENAMAEAYAFNNLAPGLHVDNNIHSNHWKPLTVSRQYFKNILHEQSRAVFQGRIFIEKLAQQSDAEQLNKNLMLTDKCIVDTKPQLDVYADDVKANHGATVGSLDMQELFYLQSRGLSREQALNLLLSAYGQEIADKLENSHLKALAQGFLDKNQERLIS